MISRKWVRSPYFEVELHKVASSQGCMCTCHGNDFGCFNQKVFGAVSPYNKRRTYNQYITIKFFYNLKLVTIWSKPNPYDEM